MKYTAQMDTQRFRKLAEELAAREPDLPERLGRARAAASALRETVLQAVEAFRSRAAELGAPQLRNLEVSPVEPDDKHVDALQFRISRGRLELLCVAIARGDGKMRVVGPFKRGKQEGPCAEAGLAGREIESLLAERLEALVREASGA
ncbi:MAG TPA: hypothetical protein VMR86_11905 [Myxococcota bacterium]|nr:hypothetical protein [Myxococcota bacterium]